MSSNRFPATCSRCEKPVAVGEGLVTGKGPNDPDWNVIHNTCIPVFKSTQPNWDEVKRPWIIGQEYDL